MEKHKRNIEILRGWQTLSKCHLNAMTEPAESSKFIVIALAFSGDLELVIQAAGYCNLGSSYCKRGSSSVNAAPPTVNAAPPTVNWASPTVNWAPPTVNWAPPTVNTASPTVNWAPHTVNTAPPTVNWAPPSVNVVVIKDLIKIIIGFEINVLFTFDKIKLVRQLEIVKKKIRGEVMK